MSHGSSHRSDERLQARVSRRRALAATGAGLGAASVGSLLRQPDATRAEPATPVAQAAPGVVTAERVAQAVGNDSCPGR
jgi:hypothetical protein